jgi:cysteine desulfuration protein SufE
MPTDTVQDRAQDIVDEFSLFGDWMGRYEYLIEMGDDIPLIDEARKTEDTYIHGCQSDVWIDTEYDADAHVLRFRGDSNAKITKGLAALIIRLLDAQPPEAVAEADFDFLDDIGLREHLTSQRNNGLEAMVRQMKSRAVHHQNGH